MSAFISLLENILTFIAIGGIIFGIWKWVWPRISDRIILPSDVIVTLMVVWNDIQKIKTKLEIDDEMPEEVNEAIALLKSQGWEVEGA